MTAPDPHSADHAPDGSDRRLQDCLNRLAAGDPIAKDELIAVAYARLEKRASQMLMGFPAVRKSSDTGDVVQEACLRLVRTLNAIHPTDSRQFLGLAGLHIRRVLIDLYRRCHGPESYEANHATNVVRGNDGHLHHHVDCVPDEPSLTDESTWTRLHAAAESLSDEDQELFHMRWFLGMTHEQIARQLGCAEKTVKRNWNRVKDLLRKQVGGTTGI